MIISGELQVQNRKKALIVQDMHMKGFTRIQDLDIEVDQAVVPDPGAVKPKVENGNEFDYLLKMAIWSLTHEKVEELKKERDMKNAELKLLIDKSAYDLWNEDLDALMAAWETLLQADIDEANYMGSGNKGKKPISRGRGKTLGATSGKVSAKKANDDDDFEDKPPKKTPASKKITTAKNESSLPSVKPEVKEESISNFFTKSGASTPSSVSTSSSVPKKQQSIVDMMKSKAAQTPVKTEVKSEPESANEPLKMAVEKKKGKSRLKKVISDSEDEADGDSDFGSSRKRGSSRINDDDDVEMDDIVVAPREARAPRAARAKRAAIVDRDTEDEEDIEESFLPSPKKATTMNALPPVSKPTKSVDLEEQRLKEKKEKKSSPAAMDETLSGDDGNKPSKATTSKQKGKATNKARSRKILSDDDDDDGDAEAFVGDNDDENGDDYVEHKPKKTATPRAASKAARPPVPGRSAAVSAAKKMFSLSNEDDADDNHPDEDVNMAEGNDVHHESSVAKTQDDNAADEVGIGFASDDDANSSRNPIKVKPTPSASKSQTILPPAIPDDDSMFSIMVPSKVSQVKKRIPMSSRNGSSTSLTGGVNAGSGGSNGEPSSSSTSLNSTGAVAGAKTLNSSSSSSPVKSLTSGAGSQLLAELDNVSAIVSRPSRARATSKKPMYVDISDDD